MGDIVFGRKLSNMRKNAGLTQKQVADNLGISNPSTVASWEGGKSEPSADTLMRLCSLYGIKDVLGEFGYSFEERYESLSHDAHRIGRLYEKADKRSREIVELTLEPFDVDDKESPPGKDKLIVEFSKELAPQTKEITPARRSLMIVGVASAGNPDPFVDMEPKPVPADDAPMSASVGYILNGTSMEPDYPDHSIVWLDTTTEVKNGDIGVFFINGEITCKQLVIDEGGAYLSPINPDHNDIHLSEFDDVRTIGKVVN